jgi:hypothetical protein
LLPPTVTRCEDGFLVTRVNGIIVGIPVLDPRCLPPLPTRTSTATATVRVPSVTVTVSPTLVAEVQSVRIEVLKVPPHPPVKPPALGSGGFKENSDSIQLWLGLWVVGVVVFGGVVRLLFADDADSEDAV